MYAAVSHAASRSQGGQCTGQQCVGPYVIALDQDGRPCIEAKCPLDLEAHLGRDVSVGRVVLFRSRPARLLLEDVRIAKNAMLPRLSLDAMYGIEANEFALHSVYVAQPELGVLPNLGYAVTLNLSMPLWDWGGLRSKVRQSEIRQRQASASM